MSFINKNKINFKILNKLYFNQMSWAKRFVFKKNNFQKIQLKKLNVSNRVLKFLTFYKKKKDVFKNIFLKKNFKKYSFSIKYFYVCLKKSKSNFFCYILNYKNCFISLSLGQTGKKGPIKMSFDAYEILGYKFGFRLFKFYLFLLKRRIYMGLILLLTFKIFKPLRKFLKKFFELGLKFIYIFILYKFAHNGCRLAKQKRK